MVQVVDCFITKNCYVLRLVYIFFCERRVRGGRVFHLWREQATYAYSHEKRVRCELMRNKIWDNLIGKKSVNSSRISPLTEPKKGTNKANWVLSQSRTEPRDAGMLFPTAVHIWQNMVCACERALRWDTKIMKKRLFWAWKRSQIIAPSKLKNEGEFEDRWMVERTLTKVAKKTPVHQCLKEGA